MRAVCQRVAWARVLVDGEIVGQIGPGWAILLGIGQADSPAVADGLVDKIATLRVFEDEAGRMHRAAAEVGAEFLIISQITLHADLSHGRRPSFTDAARPEQAEPLVAYVCDLIRSQGIPVATGVFGAHMEVELVNDGQVTLVVETEG